MSVRNFGIIQAKVDDQKKRVVLTARRGPGKLPDGTVRKLVDWAVNGCRDLEKKGYRIDISGIDNLEEGKWKRR